MFSSRKTKFKLTFAVNELSNIPHTSGYCHIDIYIGDGALHGFKSAISQLRPLVSSAPKEGREEQGDKLLTAHSSSNSNSIHLQTSRRKIHNFRCHFNYKFSCNLRFPIKRKDNMVGNKYVTLKFYYSADRGTKTSRPMELGEVKLNLAEYLNFNEPVSAKYLLQESKINSIASLSTWLEELPQDMDFHTLLQVDDSKNGQTASTAMLSVSKSTDLNNRSFNVPQFQKKTIFGGLEGVINSLSNPSNSKQNLDSGASEESKEPSENDEKQSLDHKSGHKSKIAPIGSKTLDNVIVDPIIGGLYRKVLESTWDPELHALLKLSPEEVVLDIFHSTKNKGLDLYEKDLQHYISLNRDFDGETFKGMNGLINEAKHRKNLRSWSVPSA